MGILHYNSGMAHRKLFSRKTSPLVTVGIILLLLVVQHFGWLETPPQQATNNNPGTYAVARFIDGDTLSVDMNGKRETVRMIGIDTPETHKPNTPVQCYGPAAAAFTKNLIGNQKVRLESDPKNQNRDRYNRLLRYVYLPDNKLVQKELVANGYGFAYTQFPFGKMDEFVAAERQAALGKKGLWGNCHVTEQANGRKQTNNAQ